MTLRIISGILLVIGAAVVYGAKLINRRVRLDKKMKKNDVSKFASQEDMEKYEEQKAVIVIKLIGLVFVIPGIILAFIAFNY